MSTSELMKYDFSFVFPWLHAPYPLITVIAEHVEDCELWSFFWNVTSEASAIIIIGSNNRIMEEIAPSARYEHQEGWA